MVFVITDKPGVFSNDLFVNLLDMRTSWSAGSEDDQVFEGRDRVTGKFVPYGLTENHRFVLPLLTTILF